MFFITGSEGQFINHNHKVYPSDTSILMNSRSEEYNNPSAWNYYMRHYTYDVLLDKFIEEHLKWTRTKPLLMSCKHTFHVLYIPGETPTMSFHYQFAKLDRIFWFNNGETEIRIEYSKPQKKYRVVKSKSWCFDDSEYQLLSKSEIKELLLSFVTETKQ